MCAARPSPSLRWLIARHRRCRLGFGLPIRPGALEIGPGSRARALSDARPLAGAPAQIIELGPPNHAAAHHLDRRDPRRIERKDPLHPLAIGDFAQGEVGVDPGVLAGDANPFEGLNPLALAFDHTEADPYRIPRLKDRYGPVGGEPLDLLALDLLKKIHRSTSRSPARHCCPAQYCSHKSGRRSRVRRSASARRQSRIRRWSPETSTSGTARPCHNWGRVYWGYSSRLSEKLSSASPSARPTTPGSNRTQASISAIAAGSPPDSTKSPRLSSSIARATRTRSSNPSKRPQINLIPGPSASERTRS